MARKSNNTEFIGEYEIADHKIMTMEEEKRERLIMEARVIILNLSANMKLQIIKL